MRKLIEMLRLQAAGLSARQIARSCGVARSTVREHLARLNAEGLRWPLDPALSDEDLDARLFSGPPGVRGREEDRPLPDWPSLHKELNQRKGMTLKLLWEEYRQPHPDGYHYSQFCEHYRRWSQSLDVCLRQTYRGGERLFVDYAGVTMPLYDPAGGPVIEVQILVFAMGASHYLYAEASLSQQVHDWIESHIRAFEFFQGVPELLIPDNLKSGVSRACRYDPDINPAYQDLAAHYGTAVLPARPRKPRDKAKAETAVQIIEREVLAPLRHRKFFSLAEMNQALWERLHLVNHRLFQKLEVSRHDLFIELDRPALKPLPATRYERAEFIKARVNIDYHIEVRGHYYSVPYQLRGELVEARLSARMLEVLHRNKRVASHPRDDRKGRHTTLGEHMPRAHREYLAWNPSRIIEWAGKIGPDCAKAVEDIIGQKSHPEQAYRAALGIIRLATGYAEARVNAACRRALAFDICRYQNIKAILKNGKDLEPLPQTGNPAGASPHHHDNIRGAGYYAQN